MLILQDRPVLYFIVFCQHVTRMLAVLFWPDFCNELYKG